MTNEAALRCARIMSETLHIHLVGDHPARLDLVPRLPFVGPASRSRSVQCTTTQLYVNGRQSVYTLYLWTYTDGGSLSWLPSGYVVAYPATHESLALYRAQTLVRGMTDRVFLLPVDQPFRHTPLDPVVSVMAWHHRRTWGCEIESLAWPTPTTTPTTPPSLQYLCAAAVLAAAPTTTLGLLPPACQDMLMDLRILTQPLGPVKVKGSAAWAGTRPTTMTTLRVFTDGACKNNGRRGRADARQAGMGVYVHPGDIRLAVPFNEALYGEPTNNKAEILAMTAGITQALKMIQGHNGATTTYTEVIFYSDSDYLCKIINSYYRSWVSKGWKTANGAPVKNREMIEQMMRLYDDDLRRGRRVPVSVEHVRAHQPEPYDRASLEHLIWAGNREADALAVAAATPSTTTPTLGPTTTTTTTTEVLKTAGVVLESGDALTCVQMINTWALERGVPTVSHALRQAFHMIHVQRPPEETAKFIRDNLLSVLLA